MKTVTLHNKTFEVFIAETEISAIVHSMANQINNSGIQNPLFIAVLNGSFLFAADIMRKVNIPNCEISFIKLSSYSGTKTTGEVNELIGLGQDIKNRNIVILEDIIDTGITLEKIISLLEKENVADIKVATFISATSSFSSNNIIFSNVIPVSIMSSKITTFLFLMSCPNPINSFTSPVVSVPK